MFQIKAFNKAKIYGAGLYPRSGYQIKAFIKSKIYGTGLYMLSGYRGMLDDPVS